MSLFARLLKGLTPNLNLIQEPILERTTGLDSYPKPTRKEIERMKGGRLHGKR